MHITWNSQTCHTPLGLLGHVPTSKTGNVTFRMPAPCDWRPRQDAEPKASWGPIGAHQTAVEESISHMWHGVSRTPVSAHTQIATPGVSPRKEKDNSGVDGAFVMSQNLSSLLTCIACPALAHSQLFLAKEIMALGGLFQGGRQAAFQIPYWPPLFRGHRNR